MEGDGSEGIAVAVSSSAQSCGGWCSNLVIKGLLCGMALTSQCSPDFIEFLRDAAHELEGRGEKDGQCNDD